MRKESENTTNRRSRVVIQNELETREYDTPFGSKLRVKEGDKVTAGQKVVLLEAMKMENNIETDYAGTVTSIKVREGDSIMEGDVLITIGE